MTDTKPTLKEQIEWAEVLIKCDSGIAPAVLASLKELQSIKSQPVSWNIGHDWQRINLLLNQGGDSAGDGGRELAAIKSQPVPVEPEPYGHLFLMNDDQARRVYAAEAIEKLVSAAEPLAHYSKMRDAKPINGMDDAIHSIHVGTDWEAEITQSQLRALREALAKLENP